MAKEKNNKNVKEFDDDDLHEEESKKIPLTKEDIILGKNKMKDLIKGTKKYAALYGGATLLDTLANISVTFASQDEKGLITVGFILT